MDLELIKNDTKTRYAIEKRKQLEPMLQQVTRAVEILSSVPQANELLPHVMGMYCPHCGSDDIVWYGLSRNCICNKCGKEGNIIL